MPLLGASQQRWRTLLATSRPSAPLFGLAVMLVVAIAGSTGGLIWHLRSLALASIISVVIWCLVVCAYRLVTHSYHDDSLNDLGFSEVIVLMLVSVAGGILQLPVVGGGSQLATIAVLKVVFDISPELATSCGILLWLVTFVSVTPLGLLLARREHVSFLKLAEQEERAELAHAGKSNHPN